MSQCIEQLVVITGFCHIHGFMSVMAMHIRMRLLGYGPSFIFVVLRAKRRLRVTELVGCAADSSLILQGKMGSLRAGLTAFTTYCSLARCLIPLSYEMKEAVSIGP